MKVTVIHGSPRKGNTYIAAKLFMEKMQQAGAGSVSFQEFFLPDDMPEFCRGCMSCVLNGEHTCPHKKYTLPALQAMIESDALLLASPVYVMSASAVMKNFLDHYPFLFFVHRAHPNMFTKKAYILTTAAGGGMKAAVTPMKASLKYWGVNRIYSSGYALHSIDWENIPAKRKQKIEQDIQKNAQKFYKEVNSGKKHLPYPLLSFMYLFLRKLLSGYEENSLDKQYWQQNGWFAKRPF